MTDSEIHEADQVAQAAQPDQVSEAGHSVSSSVSSAAAKGVASLANTDENFAVIDALGGVRGVVESVAPMLCFILTYMISQRIDISVGLVSVVLVGIITVRLLAKQTIIGALSGTAVTAICVLLTWISKDARDFYGPGILINAFSAFACIVTILIGRPLLGVLLDTMTSTQTLVPLRREYTLATGVWALGFIIRLACEIPLYLTHSISTLGVVRIITGVPLFAVLLIVAWMIIAPARKKLVEA